MSSPPSSPHSPQSPGPGQPAIPLEGLGADSVVTAAQLIRTGRTYDLDCGRWPSMPQWDGHAPFQVLTYRTPRGVRVQKDWDWLGTNTVNFGIHSELLSGSAHTGTHIDALCHATCGADDHWFGGSTPDEHLGDFGPLTHDAAAIPPIFTRGVLLDVAGALGVDALPASTEIGPAEIERTLSAQGSEIRPGRRGIDTHGIPLRMARPRAPRRVRRRWDQPAGSHDADGRGRGRAGGRHRVAGVPTLARP